MFSVSWQRAEVISCMIWVLLLGEGYKGMTLEVFVKKGVRVELGPNFCPIFKLQRGMTFGSY